MLMKILSAFTLLLLLARQSACDGDGHSLKAELKQFTSHDINHDGCLQKDEFVAIFKSMDVTPRDGHLTIKEFSDGWRRLHFHDTHDVTFFFMEIDRDRDAYISVNDLEFTFSSFDTSNDGCVTEAEYNNAWSSLFNV